jgi:hypothetical protein
MRTAILIVWIVGIVGALPPTLVLVKQALLVVWALLDIARLAVRTRAAAEGIAKHVAIVPTLPDLSRPAASLTDAAQGAAASLARSAALLSQAPGG